MESQFIEKILMLHVIFIGRFQIKFSNGIPRYLSIGVAIKKSILKNWKIMS